ncbi:MAG: tRNA uridine-5-carboxymethylaminomethyl(34) synthesis enzyme MnmG [Trueperaceae bacterium]|nr:MAG: tRNA uridine-5-carboxymethylaminomethyl(34) synthesis enzyme MnmG [Trueperaceae bacterium]
MVVGGGHAGIEAACAAAKLGCEVALVLPNPDKIGLMPCNPAIGGPGKSQLVYELHALGGVMGHLADATAIHARTLNSSKGPAVQSLRVQNDRDGYATAARGWIEATRGISIVRAEVASLETAQKSITGVSLTDGRCLMAPSVVLCTGTFLAGVVWYGKQQREAGRQGEAPARYLSSSLKATGHHLTRFKTGTPPRIRSDSVDFSRLQEVPPDNPVPSFTGRPGPRMTSSPTWLTHTTVATHELIQQNLEHSAMYSGQIEGRGPRYCPSIEDKIVRFADKERHLLFVEPDGKDTSELYLQGFSSSMPPVLQDEMIRTLPGFEDAQIQRYAYAVEYDAVDPTQLDTTLMSRKLKGLFSAGQINGTSGYEEASAQGLIAGVNAARHADGVERVTVGRDEGYFGVLLDDLVRWGVDEPYRMLTSRNEYRLLHRQDNAEERLLATGHAWGLVSRQRLDEAQERLSRIEAEVDRLQKARIEGITASKALSRPGTSHAQIVEKYGSPREQLTSDEVKRVEIRIKYQSYIERSRRDLQSRQGYEKMSLGDLDFTRVASLSNEGREALQRFQPHTLGAAQRLRGVRDSDLNALLVYLKTRTVSRETSTD